MATRIATELEFTTWDGVRLFYRAWPSSQPSDRGILLFHRGHEHSGRLQEFVERLDLDVPAFAWDARGHGRSPGERGYADHFMHFVKDADAFARHVATAHGVPLTNMVAVGHSVGAVIAAAWVHDFAPPLRGLVLATPAFRVKLYAPLAIPGLRLMQTLRGKFFIKSYVKARMLTHDLVQAAMYQTDPLIERGIAVNILLGLHDTSTRVVADAGALNLPMLVFAAGDDWVVKFTPQAEFVRGLSSATKELHYVPGFYHAVLHEKGRQQPIAAIRRFVESVLLSNLPSPSTGEGSGVTVGLASLLNADREGYTYQEHRRLSQPLSLLSPKRWYFAAQRLGMATIGRLSDGVRLGWRTGFDSGQTLDYVYENQPRGITPIGRLIDRSYLNAIGWRGIRARKENLQTLLKRAMKEVHAAGRRVHVLDIATGGGRYVLETLRDLARLSPTAHLRDWRQENLDAAQALANKLEVEGITFAVGDAFDEQSLAATAPAPTVGIVSGLYELFPDNEMVLRSLRGLSHALNDHGLLIYTNQPWHPQLEMIARVLTSHRDGKPWIMRRRTQAEMDELVRSVGFEKVAMEIDEWGIFTVSLARRRTPA